MSYDDPNNTRMGYLYVLSSKYLRDDETGVPLLKVGCSRKHPLTRAKELSASTGVPKAFSIAYYRDFSDSFNAESLFHKHFDQYRVNAQREFFRAPLDDAIAFIDSLAQSKAYREELESHGIIGGYATDDFGHVKPWDGPSHWEVKTPFAEMFATFEDDGSGRALTADEQARCRALERRALA